LGSLGKASRETDRRREKEMMGMRITIIERMQTCIQSNVEPERNPVARVVWREGEVRKQKPEGPIVSENGLVSLIWECYQKIENGGESKLIEKSEKSVGPRFRAPIETEELGMERVEMRTEDLRTRARDVRSPLTIIKEGIEGPHRTVQYLR
jgi:hypothetical protein